MKLSFFGLISILSLSLLTGKQALANDAVIAGQAPAGQQTTEIVKMVEKFILAAMTKNKAVIDQYLAPNATIIFTGGRQFTRPEEVGKFNASRYKWVKKSLERWDVTYQGKEVIVYSLGTLYGEWPDSTPFKGNRYIDRFVIVDGKITQMEVWNDSAELIMLKTGLVKE
jgi:hypothetical protein